jgi:hypothetical protein
MTSSWLQSPSETVPAGTKSQYPSRPDWLHFLQMPLQRSAQHKPSVQ